MSDLKNNQSEIVQKSALLVQLTEFDQNHDWEVNHAEDFYKKIEHFEQKRKSLKNRENDDLEDIKK